MYAVVGYEYTHGAAKMCVHFIRLHYSPVLLYFLRHVRGKSWKIDEDMNVLHVVGEGVLWINKMPLCQKKPTALAEYERLSLQFMRDVRPIQRWWRRVRPKKNVQNKNLSVL